MNYNQEITLDLNSNSAFVIVDAKQGDIDSRTLLVHYTSNGEEYKVNTNNSVVLRMRKSDGTTIFNDATVNYDGTVLVTFSYQCLTVAGRAYADLVEFNSSGQTLSTVSFIVNIQAAPNISAHEALSSDEFLYLKSFINRGNHIIGEAQEWTNGYNGDIPVSENNPAYNNNAKYWTENAEAWARGTKNNIPVSSSDDTYHNNAKYWAEEAETSREKIENMDAEAVQIGTDEPPTVEKIVEDGEVTLKFGIPRSNAIFITFDIDYSTGQLQMYRPDNGEYTDQLEFSLSDDGNLEVSFNVNSE